ncbi:MAG: DUF1553 domain-containing protein [Acidobacteriota bacterium]
MQRRVVGFLFCLAVAPGLPAQEAREILASRCLVCHGATRMGNVDLRTLRSGDPLLEKVAHMVTTKAMPPGKKGLSEGEIVAVAKWVKDGAPGLEKPLVVKSDWWSFQPVKRPAAPAGEGQAIDRFVREKWAKEGLQPVRKATRRELLRRVSFTLTGLPPSEQELAEFEKDARPDAYARQVDRLLASPQYGERWGRHWLDVVRYADTGGFETDIYFPNAWRYRDYVIRSFNQDKSFQQFVQEQIAGDELFPTDLDLNGGFQIAPEKLAKLDASIATGMYTIGPVYHEAALFGGQVRYEWLTDAVDTTGEAFLGLTVGCSRCHNHKFDPLTQRDYHGLMAVFAGSEEKEIPVVSRFATFGFKSGYPNWIRVEELKGAIQRIDGRARQRVVEAVRKRFSAEELAAFDVPVAKRTAEQRKTAARVESALTQAGLQENAEGKEADIPLTAEESRERERLVGELGRAALKANPVAQTATVLGAAAVTPKVHLTHRGDWRSTGEEVGPAVPAVLAKGMAIDGGGQRRSALARWIGSEANPLTARVMVNRVWHWHFGKGIVATPNDFGRQGEEPTHPELLDWLAAEFVESGWSLKKLHRMILLSETYQLSSEAHEGNLKIDANNRYLWRMNRQRLDAETLRDAVLAVSGELNLKMGGRPVVPRLSPEEYTVMWARNQWPESLEEREQTRRSVYLYVKRAFPLPMFTTFDAPDTSQSCSRRENTTVAPQALTLLNGEFMVKQAKVLAGKAGDVDGLWRRVYGRGPTAAERERAERVANREQLALVLLNTNEFLYVD